MDSKYIECKKVEFLKAQPGDRPFAKEFAEKLAPVLKEEGMRHAIVVRPNPDKPGYYIGVAGRHRHYAWYKLLKNDLIEAKVYEDMDDEDAEMARISENLWRNPLTKVQHVAALKRWYELFIAKHGEKPIGSAGGEATKKKAEAKKAESSDSAAAEVASEEAGQVAEETSQGDASANFAEMAAAATGRSVASVYKDTKIAKAFDAEQLECFEQMKVSKADMQTIAKIKDVVRRGEVVNLIAAGMEPEDAIKEVMKDEAPAREDGKSKEDRKAATAAKDEKEPELSDDEWFEKWCGEKAAMFKHPERFKSDAILFRHVSDARHAFRSKSKKSVADTKATGVTGALWNIINRLISVSHPKDWFICETCKGQGEVEDKRPGMGPAKCGKCFGGGYSLKTETYV